MAHPARSVSVYGLIIFAMALLAVPITHATDEGDGLQKSRFTFALWGDVMYTDADFAKLPALIADINASKAAFSIYDVDIKSGSSKCTDDVFGRAIGYFNA